MPGHGVLVGEDGVGRVQVDALLARDERHRLLEVGGELLEVARAAQVVARGHDAAGCGVVVALVKADDVIALPAVDRNRLACQLVEHGVGVDALLGVGLLGVLVDVFHVELAFCSSRRFVAGTFDVQCCKPGARGCATPHCIQTGYSTGRISSMLNDALTESRASCRLANSPAARNWTMRLPMLVPSMGPANTGTPQAFAVI